MLRSCARGAHGTPLTAEPLHGELLTSCRMFSLEPAGCLPGRQGTGHPSISFAQLSDGSWRRPRICRACLRADSTAKAAERSKRPGSLSAHRPSTASATARRFSAALCTGAELNRSARAADWCKRDRGLESQVVWKRKNLSANALMSLKKITHANMMSTQYQRKPYS